jgi:uncharacterized integral membrane protein (TIGR00698 family)
MSSLRSSLWGLGCCVAVAWSAYFLAPYLPFGKVMCALLLGWGLGQVWGVTPALRDGLQFAEKHVLAWAVVGMGAGLQVQHLLELGWHAIGMVLCSVGVSLWLAVLLGRSIGLAPRFSMLLGIGNGICGGSAIAGAAPLLQADENEVATGIAAVNLVGTVGMFLLPLSSLWFEIGDVEAGYLAGGTLQAVGHVTAAAYAVSEQAGQLATTLKLGRVFCMAPLFLLISFWRPLQAQPRKLTLPYFIPGFILLMLASNFGVLPPAAESGVSALTSFLLSVAMAAIGWKIQWHDFKASGIQALAVVSLLWLSQVSVVLAWLYAW